MRIIRLAFFNKKLTMKRIPLYAYVAQNNPQGAAQVITSFGFEKPNNIDECIRGLKYIMASQGESGFIEIAKQHPDRRLILDAEEIINPKIELAEKKSNACGCSSKFSGMDGQQNNSIEPTKETIRFVTPEDLKKWETEKKVEEMEKKITKEDISNEVKKVLNQSNNFITQNLPTLAIIGVGIFLYTQIKK